MEIVILPSVEYEVYHGRNFADERATLFDPTQRLLARAGRSGIPLTLFPDVCSVWAYREEGIESYAQRFEQQIVEAVCAGHDAQLHVHAHWSSAYFTGQEWRLREPRISLADLDFTTSLPATMIRRGIDYLENLLRPHVPSYRCIAFRAGGLLLEPQSALTKILSEAGIQIDSSIAKDYQVTHDALRVDHRGMPAQANWDVGNGIYEIPIATFGMNLRSRVEFLFRRLINVQKRRGAPISRARRQTRTGNVLTLLRQNARYFAWNPMFLFSADTKGYTRPMLVAGFKDYVQRHQAQSDSPIYASMINHPKLMFEEEEALLFDVLEELRDSFGERLSLLTFTDAARSLALGTARANL